MSVLYHGGIPGLRPGDLIQPGHNRDHQHDDCPICRKRREQGADAPEGTQHPETVYCTTNRLYAKTYASLYGRGDVYQVEPIGPLTPSTDEGDPEGSYRCPLLRVKRIVDVRVTLTMKERRRLARQTPDPSNPLPLHPTPGMEKRWWHRQIAMAERMANMNDASATLPDRKDGK